MTKDQGIVYFFSMATSFTKAALGAEGVGKDVTMIVGNGYTKDHATIALNLMRESKELRKIFIDKIPVLKVDDKLNQEFKNLVTQIQINCLNGISTKEIEIKVDNKIFELYSLSEQEQEIIGSIEIQ